MRCCADGAELPFSVMQIPTFFDHATFASPACSHGSRSLCVELQFAYSWPVQSLHSLNLSVKSKIICSRAFCDVANTNMSSAHATLGENYSSNLKPNSTLFRSFVVQCCYHCVHQQCEHHGACWRSLWEPLVVLNLVDSKCLSQVLLVQSMFFLCFQCLVSVHVVQRFFQIDVCCEEWDVPFICCFRCQDTVCSLWRVAGFSRRRSGRIRIRSYPVSSAPNTPPIFSSLSDT